VVQTNGVRLHVVQAGAGDPLVLLHGFPQTWFMWRRVLPMLAERRRIYALDLRGYGDSDKPLGGRYDKGTMAADILGLMDTLGLDRPLLVGHDRGARVARRFGLEFPGRVAGVVMLDILPEEHVYETLNQHTALLYWHWVFHLVPELPEQLIRGREDTYVQWFFRRWSSTRVGDDVEAVQEYLRALRLPGALEANMSDYRDSFAIDIPRYLADRAAGRKLRVPALLLWGADGRLGGQPVLDVWRDVATDVRGEEVAGCGHYVAEEQPDLVADRVLRFAAELTRAPSAVPSWAALGQRHSRLAAEPVTGEH
jgi:pimeloyl-ACP methyl ester carboxylesterase